MKNDFVFRVGQVFYNLFHFFVNAFYLVIWLVFKEYFYYIRCLLEIVLPGICPHVCADLPQFVRILMVLRVIDDDFFPKDMAMEA